jgi:hypothetical protein
MLAYDGALPIGYAFFPTLIFGGRDPWLVDCAAAFRSSIRHALHGGGHYRSSQRSRLTSAQRNLAQYHASKNTFRCVVPF